MANEAGRLISRLPEPQRKIEGLETTINKHKALVAEENKDREVNEEASKQRPGKQVQTEKGQGRSPGACSLKPTLARNRPAPGRETEGGTVPAPCAQKQVPAGAVPTPSCLGAPLDFERGSRSLGARLPSSEPVTCMALDE